MFCRDVCAPRRVTAVHFLQGYSICVFEYILSSERHTLLSGACARVLVHVGVLLAPTRRAAPAGGGAALSLSRGRARGRTVVRRGHTVGLFIKLLSPKKGTRGAHMQPRGPRPDHIIRQSNRQLNSDV